MNEYLREKLLRIQQQAESLIERAAELVDAIGGVDDGEAERR